MIQRFQRFSSAVSSLYRDMQKIERTEMAKYGLKGPHVQCMLALSDYPDGITAAKLCEICEKDKAAISRTVAELEAAGMVECQEKNGVRYRAPLKLTKQGAAAARAVQKRTLQAVRQAGEGLDDEKRKIFYEVMGLIAGNLHTICQEGLK